jgi:hypothetical protein
MESLIVRVSAGALSAATLLVAVLALTLVLAQASRPALCPVRWGWRRARRPPRR